MNRKIAALFAALSGSMMSASAALAAGKGQPEPWQLGYQEPVTDIAERVQTLSFNLHVLAFVITLFVTVLLAYVCIKFSKKNNPTPDRFTHNSVIEVIWTVVPVVILVAMAWPSIKLLYDQETVEDAELTVKAVGYQWYWGYAYDVDGEEVIFDSLMAGKGYSDYETMKAALEEEGEEVPSPMEWKLKATAPMVVPVDTVVRVQVTAADVLHAFAVPSFAVKVDAVPGRLNETWFKAKETGTYYGQCSELCGPDHSYMPIMVEVVEKDEYEARLAEVLEEFAHNYTPSSVKVAAVAAE